MKASMFAQAILNDIQDKGEDFELVGLYISRKEVEKLLGITLTDEQAAALFTLAENVADKAATEFLAKKIFG